jgi:3-deoxy-D-manno-octulosonate 8-phosphate phosphatase (KDO 8-P phosphatase)
MEVRSLDQHELNNIKLIVYDFDGVMTDNKVVLREDGMESVVVNRADGLAIALIKKMDIPQIILSTETNRVVETRARKLGIPVIKGADNKRDVLLTYCMEENILLEKVVYVGNDVNDLEVMRIVGHPVCPADAYEEIREISKIILSVAGGQGVIRDLLKYITERED